MSGVLVASVTVAAWAAWAADAAGTGGARAVSDFRPPVVSGAVIVGTSPGTIRQGGTYAIYADVSDVGTPPSGVASVTASVTSVTSGASAVVLPACTSGCLVGATMYSHRSAVLSADWPLAEGARSYSITATDAGGYARSASFSVTVSNVITATITSAPATPTKATTATFTFTGTGTSFKCKLDSGAFAVCSSGVSYSGLSQGTHTFQVVATDGALESSPTTHAWLVDTSLPSVTLTFPAAGPYNASAFTVGCATVGICGTAADTGGSGLASVKVSIQRASDSMWWNGSSFASSTEVLNAAAGTSSWSLAFPASNLGDGSFLVRAVASDAATNASGVASTTFTYDATPPAVGAPLAFNAAGAVGKPEEGESLVITFSERLSVSSLCNAWSGNTTNQTLSGAITVRIRNVSGGSDVLEISGGNCGGGHTFHFGSVDLGSDQYNTGTTDLVFGTGSGSNNSAVSWNAALFKLTITLGKLSGGAACTATCPASSAALYSPDGSIADVAGNAVSGTGSFTGRLF